MILFNNLENGIKRVRLVLPKRDRRLFGAFLVVFSLLLLFFEAPTAWLEKDIIDLKNLVYSRIFFQKPSQEILVLAIDTKTIDEAPHSWPWPNSYWAKIVNHISQNSNPRAVIIDVFFSSKKDAKTDPIEPLAKAIKDNGKIGLVSIFHEVIIGSGIQLQMFPPEKLLREAAAFWGLTQQKIDRDGRIRTFLLNDRRMKKKHLAWELQKHLGLKLPDENTYLGAKKTEIFLVLRPPAQGFPRISLIELLNNKISPKLLEGKTIVIGATAPVLHDYHETSLGLVTGPDIVASALQTVANEKMQIFRPSFWLRLAYFLLGLVIWLFMVSDFFSRQMLAGGFMLILLPFLLFAWSFVPSTYPPIGLAYLTFVSATLINFAFYRIIIASEIRESLHEAEVCGKIQQAFFPGKMLEHPSGITCIGNCLPYLNAGGDYYDFFTLKNGNIFFFLGDVSGHGISASMLTTAAKTVVALNQAMEEFSLPSLYEQLNNAIITLTKKKMMMTASAGLIDFSADKVSLISAGHLPAILKKEDRIEEFAVPGFPLGIVKKYKVARLLEFEIPKRGFLVIYSDGIIEGLNWKNDQYGFDRFNEKIQAMLLESDGNSVITELVKDLESHAEGRPYDDDVTFLVVNFNRKQKE